MFSSNLSKAHESSESVYYDHKNNLYRRSTAAPQSLMVRIAINLIADALNSGIASREASGHFR